MMRTWFRVGGASMVLSDDQLRGIADSTSSLLDGTSVVYVRESAGNVTQYAYGVEKNIIRVANALNVTVEPCDEPVLPDGLRLAHTLIPFRSRLNELTSAHEVRSEMGQSRKTLDALIPEDGYVAVSYRRSGFFENMRIRDWVADETNMNPNTSALIARGRLLARVSVGCVRENACDIAVSVGSVFMPTMSHMSAHVSCPRLGRLIAGFLLMMASVVYGVVTSWGWGSVGCLVFSCTVSLLFDYQWWRRSVFDDMVQPPHHYYGLKKTRRGSEAGSMTRFGVERTDKHGGFKRECAYPCLRSTLIITGSSACSLFIPPAGSTVSSQVSGYKAPDELTDSGVLVGVDQTGRDVFLDESQLFRGVAIVGKTGSGKSVLLSGIMQWACTARYSTPPHIWGEHSWLIDFVMKDTATVRVMNQFRSKHGLPDGRIVRVLDPNSVMFDLMGVHSVLSARQAGVRVASDMQYAFPAGDIMKDSLSVLSHAFTVGVACARISLHYPLLLQERVRGLSAKFAHVSGFTAPVSPVGWAHVMLGGDEGGVPVARAVLNVLQTLQVESPLSADVELAVSSGISLLGALDGNGKLTLSDRQVLDKCQASRNKTQLLLSADTLFNPERARLSWDMVLAHAGDYHIVFAPSSQYQWADNSMPDIMASWLMNMLWRTVRTTCDDWLASGKHIMVTCDELSMLAHSDTLSLVSMKEQGRSFGLMPVFATQYPQQLPVALQDSFLGYDTIITFDHPDQTVADMIAVRRFHSLDGDGWTGGVIQNLPAYHCAIRTRSAQGLLAGFIVKTIDFTNV